MSKADEARTQLRALALELHERAADAHAEGMALSRRSARIEQLADVCSDEQAVKFRDQLVDEGLLIVLELPASQPGDIN